MARDWMTAFVIALYVTSFCSSEAPNPTVNFSNVKVRGVVRKTRKGRDVDAFMGIPYAEPPVGNLRFSNPIPKVYSNETIMANKTGISCLQTIGDSNGDEDCLYLNVYRPTSKKSQSLPVMVYIYGGGWITGNADVSSKGPDYLLDKDIILVTMTYRLGVFGFLSTGDEVATGNFGLKDQKLALEWVQSNIADFGGDPKRVTLFGQSSGAGSVHYHTLVNHTEGLFHRYILQSGSALEPWWINDPESYPEMAKELAKLNGCPINSSLEMIDCLREIDYQELTDLSMSQFSYMDYMFSKFWGPTKEPNAPGAFLTECPRDLITRNKQRDLPFIAGVTKHEGLFITASLFSKTTTYDEIINGTRNVLNTPLGSPELVERVFHFYFKRRKPDNKNDVLKRLDKFLSDYYFFYPVIETLEQRRHHATKPFYFYSFEYRGSLSYSARYAKDNRNLGATHNDELLYLFHHDPSMFPVEGNLTMNRNDYRIVDTMVDLWTSFATKGVPQSKRVENWDPYDSHGHYLQIGKNTVPKVYLKTNFNRGRMMFTANISQETCH